MKKSDRKLPYRYILVIALALLTLGLSGCGSSGGMNDGDGDGGDGDGGTTTPSYNFTGTVFNSSGSTFSGLDVYVFSDMQKATTNTSGQFFLDVPKSLHTLVVEKNGFLTQYQLADLAVNQTLDAPVILTTTHVNPVTLLASQGSVSPIVSNIIENSTVSLSVPPQSEPFKIWDENRTSASLTLENINLNTPLPLPMPNPANSSPDAIVGGDERAPRVMVSLQPATLEMANPAVLTFPNFTDQETNQILRFNFRTHQWENVPGLENRSVPVQYGGIYGLFYDSPRNASVRGSAEEGSIIAVGDSLVSVGSEGSFFVDGVPVPPEGPTSVLAISPVDPETGERTVMQTSITLANGEQATVSFGQQTTTPKLLAIASTGNDVKSDNSDFVIITATLLDVNNAPISGIPVSFRVDGGMITSAVELAEGEIFDPNNILTDQNGMAQVKFSSGIADRANRLVSVTASTNELTPKSIPIQILGSALEVTTDKNSLSLDNEDIAQITVTAQDASGGPIFDELIAVSVWPEDALEWTPSSASYRTNAGGILQFTVQGKKSGNATLTFEALGVAVTKDFIVTSAEDQFGIVFPLDDPASEATNTPVTVVVQAPSQNNVRFSSTFGTWGNGQGVMDVAVVNRQATASLQSPDAGLATIQVFDLDNPEDVNDTMQIAFATPSSEASQISLQPGATTVGPSVGDVKNSVNLKATVKNSRDQVVFGAPVLFSLSRTTGGGEYITPVVVYTDSSGVAESTFFSGALPSDNTGVGITAQVIGKPEVTDFKSIIIGETAGSVVIGHSIVAVANDERTTYSVSVSTLVSDSAGNPVPGADVTLSAWPSKYATGYWTAEEPCEPVITGTFLNEDINRNLILDPGEDVHVPGTRGYGELTPPNSAAGTITPPVAQTDENGVAYFTLTYLNSNSVWTQAELTANTSALGSESQSTLEFWLPYIEGDECSLPDAPYDVPSGSVQLGSILLQAEETTIYANGRDTTNVYATLVDANGNIAGIGVPVTYEVTGPGGLPNLNTAVVNTDTFGVASVEYTGSIGLSEGNQVTISASATDYSPAQITLNLGIGEIFLEPQKEPVLVADGTGQIEFNAYVLDTSGQYVEGDERVGLTITGDAGGNVPNSVFTDGGVAVFNFTAPYGLPDNLATATVQLTAITTSGAQSDPVTITLNKEKVASILLEVNEPTSIPADGTSSTTIMATVRNDGGNPVIQGTPVVFTTTAGRFPDTDGDGNPQTYTTFIPAPSTGDQDGQVTVSLISQSSVDPITAEIKAESGGISQKVNITFTAAEDLPPATIELKEGTENEPNPDPAVINVKGTWENKSSEITFVVKNKNGDPVSDGFRINYSIINGPNAGETLSANYADTAGGEGEVKVVLNSGIRLGTVVIRATYEEDSAVFATVQVTVVGGLPVGESFEMWPENIQLGAMETNLSLFEVPLAANASDVYGNTVADGTRVFFKTYNMGGFVAPASSPTSDGKVIGETDQIIAASDPDADIATVFNFPDNIPDEGVTVTAETEGGPSTRVTSLAVIPATEFTQVLFAGTNGGGIYKSTDSGSSWNNVTRSSTIRGQNWIDPYVNDVTFDPDDFNTIYAVTGLKGRGDVYRSNDGGISWTNGGLHPQGLLYDYFNKEKFAQPVLKILCDDNGSDWLWIGMEQGGLRYSQNGGETWNPDGPKIGSGITVNDIVKVQGNAGSALLYAGTSIGVYRSIDGGQSWAKTPGNFVGNYITTMDIHPSSTGSGDDVIYVGTEDAGVWVSSDSGGNWIQFISGMADNEGNIRDLLVDEGNNRLYATTYYFGNLDAHAVGNLYVHELRSNGTMEIGIWGEANNGLPPFDDEDPTLLAQNVLASVPDRFGDYYKPRSLFAGGEGISLLKATDGLDSGDLTWTSSQIGLNNTIMSRVYIPKKLMDRRSEEGLMIFDEYR